MKQYRITVRDANFDGKLLNPTAYSEVVECPESALNDMIMSLVHERFGYDNNKLESMDLRFAYIEL